MTLSHYCLFDTAFGTCGIAWRGDTVTRFRLPEADRDATAKRMQASGEAAAEAPPASVANLIENLRRYFVGEPADFTKVPVDFGNVDGSPYPAIYRAVQSLPWGTTATYGAIARRVGAPATAQMVGQAMARNPVPVIVPCHRVLAAGNAPGGFSAHGGVATKERLLAMEGVRLEITPRLPGL